MITYNKQLNNIDLLTNGLQFEPSLIFRSHSMNNDLGVIEENIQFQIVCSVISAEIINYVT